MLGGLGQAIHKGAARGAAGTPGHLTFIVIVWTHEDKELISSKHARASAGGLRSPWGVRTRRDCRYDRSRSAFTHAPPHHHSHAYLPPPPLPKRGAVLN